MHTVMKSLLQAPVALALMTPAAIAATFSTATETMLTASDTATGDDFGYSVGISGQTAIVGAVHADAAGTNSGSVYLFDTATGEQTAKLMASDTAAHDLFGASVGISGDTAIVGAWAHDHVWTNTGNVWRNTGAAYLFDASTGAEIATLAPSDIAWSQRFGYSVGISGDTAIVSAVYDHTGGYYSGAAYLFDVNTGDEIAKLVASDAAADDQFGNSVGISGDVAIVGAYRNSDAGYQSGSAYLFDATTGVEIAKLTASDAAERDYFGHSVAISGDTAIVGAYGDEGSGTTTGAAYLFDAKTGAEIAKLTAPDEAYGALFGYSVGIFGDIAIVGATSTYDETSSGGLAYLFDATTGDFITKLVASNTGVGDRFGYSVAISADAAIAGANYSDVSAYNGGAAYVFSGVTSVVPLPASAWLLISCLGFLALSRRRVAQQGQLAILPSPGDAKRS